jgi:hypothetical protein
LVDYNYKITYFLWHIHLFCLILYENPNRQRQMHLYSALALAGILMFIEEKNAEFHIFWKRK